MTDMESRYNRESGRLPSRLLSCEFFDNAITALCRQMLATRGRALHHKQGIEMHYFYDPPTHEFPNDELQFIVIFDKGPGMNKHELKGWAEMAHKTKERMPVIRHADLLEDDNQDYGPFPNAPYQADARTAHFGKGSKASAFYFGTSVEVHTKAAGAKKVLMMSLDERKMEARSKAGQDPWEQELRSRELTQAARYECFVDSEKRWNPLMDLLKDADESDSYSLFIIRGITNNRKRELLLPYFPAMASELRDMFMVYCDGMGVALEKLKSEQRATPLDATSRAPAFPQSKFKYSELHINLIAHRRHGNGQFTVPYRLSLRDDAPAIDWTRAPDWQELSREHRQGGWTSPPAGARLPTMDELLQIETSQVRTGAGVGTLEWVDELKYSLERSPTRLLELCAPELFYFRVRHHVLGPIIGMALYMPMAQGEETKDQIKLHGESVAVCFWKGRQMPYARLSRRLPFMNKNTKDAEEKKIKERVRLMLFFGTVAEVDDCKFKFNDDIEERLNPERRKSAVHAEDPYSEFQRWNPDAAHPSWNRMTNSGATGQFEAWLKDSHNKYDRSCQLKDRLPPDEVKALENKAGRKVDSDKIAFRQLVWGAAVSRLTIKQDDKVIFNPTGMKIEASFSGGTKPRQIVGSVLWAEVKSDSIINPATGAPINGNSNDATCDVIVRREPVEIHGQIYSVKCNLIIGMAKPEIKNLLLAERKKAPCAITATFIRDEASGADSGTGTRKDAPYEVQAGQALPIVAVRAKNAEGKEVVNWLRPNGTTHAHLHVVQSVHHAADDARIDGYDTTKHTSGSTTIGRSEKKSFVFNHGGQVTLALQQPGEYKLHYELLPMRTGHAFQTATAEPSPLPPPSAALYVRVRPGKVEEMRLKLMEKTENDAETFDEAEEMFLGRRYAIECTFFDAQGNPCTLKKSELGKTTNEQQDRIDASMRQGQKPRHLIDANDIRIDYAPPAEGQEQDRYPITFQPVPNSKKKPVEKILLLWGALPDDTEKRKDKRNLSAVAPTQDAIDQKKFSRTKAQNITATVSLLLPDEDEPENTAKFRYLEQKITIPVKSDARLKLEMVDSPLAVDKATAESHPSYNRAYLPPLRFQMVDEYGAVQTGGRRKVQLTTEPPCDGLHEQMSTNPSAAGVASFEKLQLRLPTEQLEKPIKLIFSADNVQQEAWLHVLPSGKPVSLELDGPAQLKRVGAASGVDKYELVGSARAAISGLRLLPRDEAKTRLRDPKLELKIAGKVITGTEKSTWLDGGALPTEKLKFPDKVSEPNEVMFEVTWPADDKAPEAKKMASLTLKAEAGEPAKFECLSSSGSVLGRTRNSERLSVCSGESLASLVRIQLTDESGNPCPAPADLAAEVRLDCGTEDEGPWFEVGQGASRSRKLRLGTDGSGGLVRGARGGLELHCAIVGVKQDACTLTVAEVVEAAGEGGQQAGPPVANASWRRPAASSSTPATEQGSRSRPRPLGLTEQTVAFDLRAGEPAQIQVCDWGAFRQVLTRGCFELRLEVRDATGLNVLEPDELDNIKLSVESPCSDKVDIQWGAQTTPEGKLKDPTAKVDKLQLVLPYVAWKAPRDVAKIEHTLKVSATLGGRSLEGYREFKTGCTELFVSGLVVMGSEPSAGAAGSSAADATDEAGLKIVDQGRQQAAGTPAPKLMVRAVMDGQDGKDGKKLVLMKPGTLRPAARQEGGAWLSVGSEPVTVELELSGRGAAVPLRHVREDGHDHFELSTDAEAVWCAGGALTGAGTYTVYTSYREERPDVRNKLCGPAAAERTLKRKKVYEFAVVSGSPVKVGFAGRRPPDGLAANNTTQLQLAKKLQLQLFDEYGNKAGTANGEPSLQLRLDRLPETPQEAVPPEVSPDNMFFKPFNSAGASECGSLDIQLGSGRGDAVYQLTIVGDTQLELPAPLRITFTDTRNADELRRQQQEAEAQQRHRQAQEAEQRRTQFDQLQEKQSEDAIALNKITAQRLLHTQQFERAADTFSRLHVEIQGVQAQIQAQLGLNPQQLQQCMHPVIQAVQSPGLHVVAAVQQATTVLRPILDRPQGSRIPPRTGYAEHQFRSFKDAAQRIDPRLGRVLGSFAELFEVSCDMPAETARVAALLSDLAGRSNLKAIVAETKAGGDAVKQRLGNPAPRVWALELVSTSSSRSTADGRAKAEAARSLGLPQLHWPAGGNAADFLACDDALRGIRDSLFGGILIFASEAEGAAYKRAAKQLRAAGRPPAIVCLDGFYLAAQGYYDDQRRTTDLHGRQEHLGTLPPAPSMSHQRLNQLVSVLEQLSVAAQQLNRTIDDSRPHQQAIEQRMTARQQQAAPLGHGRLSDQVVARTTRHSTAGAGPSGSARARPDGGMGQSREQAMRPRH